MTHKVTIELPEDLYLPIMETATRSGILVEDLIVDKLRATSIGLDAITGDEITEGQGLSVLLKFAGCIHSSHPRGADNDAIDEDLAREYGSSHEPE